MRSSLSLYPLPLRVAWFSNKLNWSWTTHNNKVNAANPPKTRKKIRRWWTYSKRSPGPGAGDSEPSIVNKNGSRIAQMMSRLALRSSRNSVETTKSQGFLLQLLFKFFFFNSFFSLLARRTKNGSGRLEELLSLYESELPKEERSCRRGAAHTTARRNNCAG